MPLAFKAESMRLLQQGAAEVRPRVLATLMGRRQDSGSNPQERLKTYFGPDRLVSTNPVSISLPTSRTGAFDLGTWGFRVADLLPEINPDSELYDANYTEFYGGYLGSSTASFELGVKLTDGTYDNVAIWTGNVVASSNRSDGSTSFSCADHTRKALSVKPSLNAPSQTLAGTNLEYLAATDPVTMVEDVLTNADGVGLPAGDLDTAAFSALKTLYQSSDINWKLIDGGADWNGDTAWEIIAKICRQSFLYVRVNGAGKITVHSLFPDVRRRPRLVTDADEVMDWRLDRKWRDTATKIVVQGDNIVTAETATTEPWDTRHQITDDADNMDLLQNDAQGATFATYLAERQAEPWADFPAIRLGPAEVDIDLFDNVSFHGRTFGEGSPVSGTVMGRKWREDGSGEIRLYEDPWSADKWTVIEASWTRDRTRLF